MPRYLQNRGILTNRLPRPGVLEILKKLPRTNCRECGRPTCLVMAARLAEGAAAASDCPALAPDAARALETYLNRL